MVEGNKENQKGSRLVFFFFSSLGAEKASEILCARISSEIRSVRMSGD